ncbi:unnamed protein product [Nyctereutes procyonoides]|uniref:Large ribosomal subunit protein eL22 n=1 Tax=Nyctereutes procyonoides TaxID=34880 RepID=A0A811ZQX4_NYCPR|nr:unnamed protein product [Nyctereutes procyonoides]
MEQNIETGFSRTAKRKQLLHFLFKTRRGIRSRVSRIAPWAKGRRQIHNKWKVLISMQWVSPPQCLCMSLRQVEIFTYMFNSKFPSFHRNIEKQAETIDTCSEKTRIAPQFPALDDLCTQRKPARVATREVVGRWEEGLMGTASFEQFLPERIKMNRKARHLSGGVLTTERKKEKEKEYLKKNNPCDSLSVVANSKENHGLHYFQVNQDKEEEEDED